MYELFPDLLVSRNKFFTLRHNLTWLFIHKILEIFKFDFNTRDTFLLREMVKNTEV